MPDKKMDAISLLEEDHKKVEKLFKDVEKAKDESQKQELYQTIRDELMLHTRIEQEIFYPACEADQGEEVAESIEEHRVIQDLLSELESVPPSDERFEAKMSVMQENVEHHAKEEEEKKMFPKAKRSLGMERLRELGEQMEQMKMSAQGSRRAA